MLSKGCEGTLQLAQGIAKRHHDRASRPVRLTPLHCAAEPRDVTQTTDILIKAINKNHSR